MARVVAVLSAVVLGLLPRLGDASSCMLPVTGPETDFRSPVPVHDLPGGGALIQAHTGWFRLDPAATAIVPMPGPETAFVNDVRGLPGGGALIQVNEILFRLDPAATAIVSVPGPETGFVRDMRGLPGGGALIQADSGLFRLDPGATAIVSVPGPETGFVDALYDLPGGGTLIGAGEGLFRIDPAATAIVPVPGPETGAVFDVHDLPGGGALIGAARGLFRFDPAATEIVPVPGPETGGVPAVHGLPGGGALIQAGSGVFRLNPAATAIVPVPGLEPETVDVVRGLPGGGALIETSKEGIFRDWFRLDPAATAVVPVPGPETPIEVVHDLPGGGRLIQAATGWFRFDPAATAIVPVPGPETGIVFEVHDLPGGGTLIQAERGLFRLNPAMAIVPVPGPETGGELDFSILPGGGALIGAARGLFRLDAGATAIVPIPGPETGGAFEVHDLPGGALIQADRGWFLFREVSWLDAQLTLENQSALERIRPHSEEVASKWRLRHPCAAVADHLQLHVLAGLVDADPADIQRSRAVNFVINDAGAQFTAGIAFPEKGDWHLQLASGATGVDEPIGEPKLLRIEHPLWERLQGWAERWWQRALVAAGFIYIGSFCLLFLLARRSTAVSRILVDPVWSKLGVWPFFLLRHWPPAQRWVLEPWFQAVRGATRTDQAYLDLPVTDPTGAATEASGLLSRLRTEARLWLQGRAGMGKSSAFSSWERTYFAGEATTLADAAQRFGFVLVMLPVRHYATLLADASRPELWVVEAVRRRFEYFGLAVADRNLVEAMLRAGGIALALDGMNEADRDTALTAFAQTFPQVPLLVTSQGRGPESFKVWRLPGTITDYVEDLMRLWLEPERGAALAARVRRDGLMPHLLSGYDVRLVADLAGGDPEHAPLPDNRIGLYRAVLTQAQAEDGSPLTLEPLKELAWSMLTEKRRELREADVKQLGQAALAALTRKGAPILRPVGSSLEFRHDQMRSFLAALWLVEEAPSIAGICKRLDGSAVWRCSRRDQEEVWRFVADLLPPQDLAPLWRYTAADPAERAFLQAALQARAEAAGIGLRLERGGEEVA